MSFKDQIIAFNQMYGLPVAEVPSIPAQLAVPFALNSRLVDLHKILLDEVREVTDIMDAVERGESEVEVLTMLADWLGDLQVYCASEMAKFGLDNAVVLEIIMRSNMSKLGADGKPIIKDGKVMKGPNFFPPEPMLTHYILAQRNEPKEQL